MIDIPKATPLEVGLAVNVGNIMIGPIPVEEIKEGLLSGEGENFKKFQDEEFKREFYSMTARLFGPNGNDGVLADIKESIKEFLDTQKELRGEVSELKTKLVEELAQERSIRKEEDTKIGSRLEKVEKDLDGVGEIARTVRDRNGKFWGKVRDAAIPVLVAALLVLLVLGIQAYFNQGRRLYDPLVTQPIACVETHKSTKIFIDQEEVDV